MQFLDWGSCQEHSKSCTFGLQRVVFSHSSMISENRPQISHRATEGTEAFLCVLCASVRCRGLSETRYS